MNAFWTRGYRNERGVIQMGLAVVRPGWVAFLPLGVPMGPSEQFALGASRAREGPGAVLRMDVPWQGRYPIMAWWQHGEHVLDQEVRRALEQPGAAMLTSAEAGLVSRKYSTAFVPFAPETAMITLDQPPPPALASMWRPGVLPFQKKKALVVCAIISAVLIALAATFTAILWVQYEEFNPIPLGFFGFIVGVIWFAIIMRVREHSRDVSAAAQAGSPIGPYR